MLQQLVVVAGNGGTSTDHAAWRALIAASFFDIPEGECPTCTTSRSCANYFCMKCTVGGLCEAGFWRGAYHAEHPRLRVCVVAGALSVCKMDLGVFLTAALLDRIQLQYGYQRLNCKVYKPDAEKIITADPSQAETSSRRGVCRGCGGKISSNMVINQADSPVCSLECLLDHALAQLQRPRQRPRKQSQASIVRSVL